MSGCMLGDQAKAMLLGRGRSQVQSGDQQAGGGQVDVTVDERRRDEGPVEVDDLGVTELAAAHVVAA